MELLLNRKVIRNYQDIDIPKKNIVLKNLLKISIPAALETLLISIVGLADTVMVSAVGTSALAAVSIAQQPVYLSLAASIGFSAGVTAIVARRRGENNQAEAQKVLRQSIILGLITGLFFAVLTIGLAKPIMILVGANEDTLELSTKYLQIVTTALVFNYLRVNICSALRAVGDVRTTLFTNLAANVINIIFNYFLIGGHCGFPALGVIGAAIATVIGNTVAFIISVFIIRFKPSFVKIKFRNSWCLDKKCAKDIITVSSSDIDTIQKIVDVFVSKDNNFGQYKFAHSMLLDFFVAKAFVRTVNSNKSIRAYLTYSFSVEINVMISELFKEYGAETAFANLIKQTPKNVLEDADLLCEFLQHLHRTEQYEEIYKYVEELIASSPRLSLCTKVILLHSLLVAGKEKDEAEYYDLLANDEEFAKLHIGGALKASLNKPTTTVGFSVLSFSK